MFLRVKHSIVCLALALPLAIACAPAPQQPADTPPEIAPPAPAAPEVNGLRGWVQSARAEHKVIALGAVVASRDGILEVAVDGVRAHNTDDAVQVTDRWHLGSNTKALTALLYAQMVQQDLAAWDMPVSDLFPEFSDEIDPSWHDITIEDLFAHRSGLQQMGGGWLNARHRDERPIAEQRLEVARLVLSKPPSQDPHEFNYNNLNYIVAGAAIENIVRTQDDLPDTWPDTLPETWEAAMQVMLFDRLASETDRSGFGFGPPQEGLQGHRITLGTFTNAMGRGKNADNPMVLGPAGTLNATLQAHAQLALEFLKDDSALIPLSMREKLFTPHPDVDSDYAMGWGIYDDPKYGRLYLHSGSNTMWYSRIIIAPDLDRVIIVNANQFSDAAQAAVRDVTVAAFDEALLAAAPQ